MDVHAMHTDTHKGLTEGPYTDWEHKTLSNEIQFCGHGVFPREKSLEKVQCPQSEFVIRGKLTHTHTPAKKSQSLVHEQERSQMYSRIQAEKVKHRSLTCQD